MAVGGLVLNLILVAGGIDDLITRNVITMWLPAAVMVAGGSRGTACRRARRAGHGRAVRGGLSAAVGVATERKLQRPDWRGVARVLGVRPAPGPHGRAILVQHYRDLLPLSLYLPGLRFWRHGGRQKTTRDRRGVDQRAAGQAVLVGRGVQSHAVAGCRAHTRSPGSTSCGSARLPVHDHANGRDQAGEAHPADVARALTETTLQHDELLTQRP